MSNLNFSSKQYNGDETIRVGDGNGLPISAYYASSLPLSSSSFLPRNLLHVPSITKNLVYVLQFCIDNCCFFEFHSSHFSVKDS